MGTNDSWSAFGVPIVLISNYALKQEFKCEICGITYKTKRGFNRHQSIVRKYNILREGLCVLPFEAVNQFKKDLTYIIGSKLKAHYSQSGRQAFSFPCLESLFFEVFKGYIHYFSQKNNSYKCFFHGPDAYIQLASIFNNLNWGVNFLTMINKRLSYCSTNKLKKKIIIRKSQDFQN
ncbi:hypothetical protein C2G38_688346 [Gigaspora rosea]|uniref:C2H2-type domain-containing protein n=1 Tax=Gigaspora rosea TaxID=44941 RepID=A0A397W5V2_9GLOM|nr:hypothetical protein C2G38_688346 [Gigaspora rosea]